MGTNSDFSTLGARGASRPGLHTSTGAGSVNATWLRGSGERPRRNPGGATGDTPAATTTTAPAVPDPRNPWSASEEQASWHFTHARDESDGYANNKALYLSFYQLAADKEVNFKAFITALNQNFTSDWGTEQVFGRNDPIMTFKNTTRKMNVSFQIPAASLAEAKVNLARCNLLAQFMYPAYLNANDATTIAKPPLIRLAFANLVRRSMVGGSPSAKLAGLLATVGTLNIVPSFDDEGFFDPGSSTLYPKLITVDMDFTILHERDLGWDADGSDGTFGFNGPGDARVYPFGDVEPRAGRIDFFEDAPIAAAEGAGDEAPPAPPSDEGPSIDEEEAAAPATLEGGGSDSFNSLGLRNSSGGSRSRPSPGRSSGTGTPDPSYTPFPRNPNITRGGRAFT